MRVLHCIHSLAGGGAETQLAILTNEMSQMGLGVAVFFVTGEPKKNNNITYYQCGKNKYPLRLVQEIKSAISSFRPDVIHAWLPATINIGALIAGKLKGVPIVTSIRNRREIDSPLRLLSYTSTLLMSDGIISNNPIRQSTGVYQYLFKRKKGKVIGNAVNVTQLSTEKSGQGSSSTISLLYVGRLTKQKNVGLLFKALAALSSEIDVKLEVCGVGEEEESLRGLAKQLGIDEKISFNGFQSPINNYMRNADLLILPSLYEGMPNAVVEALAYGVPALVSSIPAHTQLFTNYEVEFFESNNYKSLAQKLTAILQGKIDMTASLVRAQEFVALHSVRLVAEKYVEYYDGVLRGNNKYG